MSITLYASRLCPWAHRAYIALSELGLDYTEVQIDLTKPREPWYLEINPVRPPPLLICDRMLTSKKIIEGTSPVPEI